MNQIMKTSVIYFWTYCHFAVVLSLSELGNIISNIYYLLKKKYNFELCIN